MLSLLLASLTIAPSTALRVGAPSLPVAGAEAQGQGRKTKQGPAQARKPPAPAKKNKKKATPKPGPILRGMLDSAAKAKQQIQQKAGGGPSQPGGVTQRPFVQDAADAEQILEWFVTCDYNENGWISFREAAVSMGFDRPRYQYFDADVDGRLDLEEFTASYEFSIRYAGGFRPPRPKPGPRKPPQRTPDQIRNAYDTDLDAQLSEYELARVLADYDRTDVTAEQVMRRLDLDTDNKLAGSEIDGLIGILHPVAIPTADVTTVVTPEVRPATIDELFGAVVLRDESGSTPNPPLIRGPVPHFRRLDLDNDGKISVRDLDELLRPHQIGVRVATVVNTLDLDGDGTLSPAEFHAALVHVDPAAK